MKLTTHLQLVPRSRMVELYLCFSLTSSCRSAYWIKARDNFTLLFIWHSNFHVS
jgi:hypothetical protein